MQENSLYKAIYNLGSVKAMVKQLGIKREHIYSWIKGISNIPLEYALQIEYLTVGEIHWSDNVFIFGDKTLHCYKQHHKRTLAASWRVSLADLAKGHYDQSLFIKNFFISERVAIGLELEKFFGKRQGQRNNLKNKTVPVTATNEKEDISRKLMQNSAQVYIKKYVKLRQLIANRLGFGSHFTYLSAKKIKLYGSELLVACVDRKELAISTAARLGKLPISEQNKILAQSKKDIIKKSFEISRVYFSNELSVNSKFTSNEEKHVLSNVRY